MSILSVDGNANRQRKEAQMNVELAQAAATAIVATAAGLIVIGYPIYKAAGYVTSFITWLTEALLP